MKGMLYLCLLATCLLSGCGMQEREAALKKREAALALREQELVRKEESLRLREETLLQKQQSQDSALQDSSVFANANLEGRWSVKMVCTETSCAGSAIGDTKSELWDFSYQNGRVMATAIENNLVVRTYSGTYKNNLLELTETVERSSESPATQILVHIKPLSETTMEGQREIIRLGDCRIVYALELTK